MSEHLYIGKNSEYLKKNPTWHREYSAWKVKKIYDILEKNRLIYDAERGDGRCRTFADVGCGAGGILSLLAEKLPANYLFEGYDISEDAISFCETLKHEKLRFYCKNIFEIDKRFDFLMAIDVFEHIPDYYTFLKLCKEKAVYKIFHIPLDISIVNVILNRFNHLYDLAGHIHFFTEDIALLALRNCGYEIIDYQFTMRAFDFLVDEVKLITKIAALPRTLLNMISPKLTSRFLGGGSLLVLAK
ncbi:MAG: class I SAM-dependent methyltransferase [Spirochaetaceae bacterium]|jgi:SAM-dependent methyltransferase|nr:class I SAM-dependent methyltransferase [Spirochaetaceae bacterium]